MADDPNRDILPVKDGSYVDTYRSNIDPRERHLVCKLDRYQLEDKYLRLLDEAYNLKKSYNTQEDKLKKLATKLMRVSANPRSCTAVFDVCDDKNRIAVLEQENSKLKEKLATLRNQLLNHTLTGRSRSRGPRPQTTLSSGPATCRSEIGRAKISSCQCIVQANNDDIESQNTLAKIEDWEMQRKDMTVRIGQLEKELAIQVAGNQREKATENVEYIRVWRQMKRLNDKLIAAQRTNEISQAQINDLKKLLDESNKNYQEVTAVLTAEKKRIADINEQVLMAKDSQRTAREKDERIRDLLSELKILQQHNNELIALSARYGQIEMENMDLKKKLSENLYDQRASKIAFNEERTNIAILQNVNEQLLLRIGDLQKNIDSLTVRLESFQTKNGKIEASPSAVRAKRTQDTKTTVDVESSTTETQECRKCCEAYEKISRLEKAVSAPRCAMKNLVSVEVQTTRSGSGGQTREQGSSPIETINENRENDTRRFEDNTNFRLDRSLTPKKMLELLEEAQINASAESARIGLQELTGGNDFREVIDLARKHSGVDIDRRKIRQVSDIGEREKKATEENVDKPESTIKRPNGITSSFYDILDGRSLLHGNTAPWMYQSLYHDRRIDVEIPLNVREKSVKETNDSAVECTCDEEKRCVSGEDFPHECCKFARQSTNRTASCVEFRHAEILSAKNTTRSVSSNNRRNSDVIPHARVTENRDDETRNLDDPEESIVEPESVRSSCSVNCPKNCPSNEDDSSGFLVGDNQGLLEIHILSLQLSDTAWQILSREKNLREVSIFISWEILGETAHTSAMKCPKLNFNSSFVFRIPEVFVFFESVRSECVVFLVNVVGRNKTSYTVARTKLRIDNILDYPEKKLHHIAPVTSVLNCSMGMKFGQLSLWLRLSCDFEKVETFKRNNATEEEDNGANVTSLATIHETQSSEESSRPREDSIKSSSSSKINQESIDLKEPELKAKDEERHIDEENDFQWSSDTEKIFVKPSPPVKKLSIVGTKEEIESPLGFDRTDEDSNGVQIPLFDLGYVPNFTNESSSNFETMDNEEVSSDNDKTRRIGENAAKPIVQEEGEGKFDDAVQVETASIVEFNSLLANPTEEEVIVIEVRSMILFPDSSVVNDDDVKMLYIEYSFLGQWGKDMETKSLEKSTEEMIYRFRKKFFVDEESHAAERNTLLAMLEKSIDPNIRFIVVSEPIPQETEIKDCVEVGIAVFNVRENSTSGLHRGIELPIFDVNDKEEMGILTISVWGLDTVRRCLLDDGM